MSFRKGLANVLRAVANELDPNGNGGNFNVNTAGAGMNFSVETEVPNNLRSELADFGNDVCWCREKVLLRNDGSFLITMA